MSETTAVKTLNAVEVMLERHSVRNFKRDVVIPEETLNEILTLAASAPSSWNLQQWRFLVVKEQANKDRLLPIAFNQQQVSDASVVVVVLGDLQANLTGHEIYDAAVEGGYLSQEIRDNLVGQIDGAYGRPNVARDEANKNAGLASMQLMLAAKAKGYDTVPMGGFNGEALVKELNIPERYFPVMMIPIGVAEQPARPSGRLSLDQLVINESF